MLTRKRILVVAGAALLTFILLTTVGCGNGKENGAPPSPGSGSDTTNQVSGVPNNGQGKPEADWKALYEPVLQKYREAQGLTGQQCIDRFFNGTKPTPDSTDSSLLLQGYRSPAIIDGGWHGSWKYAYCDVNEDGTPELFITVEDTDDGRCPNGFWDIYTINSEREPVLVSSSAPGFYSAPLQCYQTLDGIKIIFYYGDEGQSIYEINVIKDNQLLRTDALLTVYDYENTPASCKHWKYTAENEDATDVTSFDEMIKKAELISTNEYDNLVDMYCGRGPVELDWTVLPVATDLPALKGVVNTPGDVLNVRSHPESAGKDNIVGTLNDGATVIIKQDLGDWYIIDFDGKDAFISSDFVRIAS